MACCVFQVGVRSGSVTCGICQMDEYPGSLSDGHTSCTWVSSKGGLSFVLRHLAEVDDNCCSNSGKFTLQERSWIYIFSKNSHDYDHSLCLFLWLITGPHRLWECMHLPDEDLYVEIMQQADASALRLFEALVVTLPETLFQTYVLICTDIGIKSPSKN